MTLLTKIKMFFTKLKWRIYRKFNNDNLPCQDEVSYYIVNKTPSANILRCMLYYIYGDNIEVIATRENITRERVRQYILKGTR